MIPYTIKQIKAKIDMEYIKEHHYTHGCHNGISPVFGLYSNEDLIRMCKYDLTQQKFN